VNVHDEKPMFVQIIEMIEDDILAGVYDTDDLIISTPQISRLLSVNPATAQRAITVLIDRGIVYKKRGIGMAVAQNAQEQIMQERKKEFFERGIVEFISGAKKIGVTQSELIQLVKERFND
jgi:DNA-binding transcriptional regulator YhcF (GntR family)